VIEAYPRAVTSRQFFIRQRFSACDDLYGACAMFWLRRSRCPPPV
jgi:hypothetical protein